MEGELDYYKESEESKNYRVNGKHLKKCQKAKYWGV